MREFAFSIYSYLTDFIKMWLVLWGLLNLPLNKNKKVLIITNVVLFIILILAGYYSQKYTDISINIWTITVIFVSGFLFEGNFIRKLGYSMLAYMLILFLEICVVGISSLFVDKYGSEVINFSIMRLIYNTVNTLFIFIIIYIKKFKRLQFSQIVISKRVYALLFAGAGTGVITLAALMVNANSEVTEKVRRVIMFLNIIAFICYMASCLMIVIISEARDKYKALSVINANIIESQQKYYALVHEKQQEIRGLRHEMKNHLTCIYALLQAEKGQELKTYLEQLIETSESTGDILDTGNDIVNAVLNDAQCKCKKDNIKIHLEGGFPKELYILSTDLCVIFANLVSNAVEAIQDINRDQQNEYYIDLSIKSFKEDLFIQIKNPIRRDRVIDVTRLQTTKANKGMHGFGVKNIMERVGKYHGNVKFQCENSEFCVNIEMKNRA